MMKSSKGVLQNITKYILILLISLAGISTASAGLIIAAGDETPAFYAANTGNDAFFTNILQGGTTVVGHELATLSIGNNLDAFYNGLSGVSSTYVSSSVINDAMLSGVDLFVTGLYGGALAPSEIAALNSFVASGGSVMFMGEYTNSFDGINAALVGIGSGMSLYGDYTDSGNNLALIASDPLTTGVSQFTYGATYGVSGGTPLFYDSTERAIFAYETVGQKVPEPATLLLLGVGLLGLTCTSKNRKSS
jgi:hypothetical protein